MRSPDVLVIGGGVSGLVAAVDLCSRGISVLVAERKSHCGGRTYSFIDEKTGDDVDNGQHLMMGCYHSTLKFLRTIGSVSHLSIQPSLRVAFRHADNGGLYLSAPRLPQPFNILVALLRLKSLSLAQRLSLLRVGAALMFTNPDSDSHLNAMTVTQWLNELHQPDECKKYLWDIIAIGTLNDAPEYVSAALFAKVLKSAFFGPRINSSMVVPRKGLDKIFVEPSLQYIQSHDGAVLTNVAVTSVEVRDGQVTSVTLGSGEVLTPRAVVCAVPHYDVSRIFAGKVPEVIVADNFVSSPIITLHLWFDKEFITEDFVALLDSPVHWIFNKSKIYNDRHPGRLYLSLVISGASKFLETEKEELVSLACSELRRFYPESSDASLLHSVVIKEKRATFSPRVGMEQFRPSHRTTVRNLFFAGDWTDTKLPATIEGATQSGYACSELVWNELRG
jgi:hydroxysqualene dehydroxylase